MHNPTPPQPPPATGSTAGSPASQAGRGKGRNCCKKGKKSLNWRALSLNSLKAIKFPAAAWLLLTSLLSCTNIARQLDEGSLPSHWHLVPHGAGSGSRHGVWCWAEHPLSSPKHPSLLRNGVTALQSLPSPQETPHGWAWQWGRRPGCWKQVTLDQKHPPMVPHLV